METPDSSYEIRPRPYGSGYDLTGPVGSEGRLWFVKLEDAEHYADFAAQHTGGILRVMDPAGACIRERRFERGLRPYASG